MVRKAGATDKKSKGSQKNETYMAGITESADFVQKFSDPRGSKLDHDVAKAVNKPVKEVVE
ncbi:hypothetical protein [Zhaonella formicivorans]|uniref:hypothetical protein n=1 Tax=Zhaonella formicivorans TaxID=2528593 RepID=UPI0010E9EC93|nr:hypothetical protein [Zhaonella formicivorans]